MDGPSSPGLCHRIDVNTMESIESNNFKDSQNLGVSFSETICVRVDEEFKEELEEVSSKYNLPLSHIIRMTLSDLLKAEAKASEGDQQ